MLIQDGVLIAVPSKYINFANIFSPDLAIKSSEYTRVNNHFINLVKDQQLLYKPIYSLGLIELETLKMYIETNLSNGFIKPFKFPTITTIFFIHKANGYLWLCFHYLGFNILIIKNQYSLPLIGKLLDQLGQTKKFI